MSMSRIFQLWKKAHKNICIISMSHTIQLLKEKKLIIHLHYTSMVHPPQKLAIIVSISVDKQPLIISEMRRERQCEGIVTVSMAIPHVLILLHLSVCLYLCLSMSLSMSMLLSLTLSLHLSFQISLPLSISLFPLFLQSLILLSQLTYSPWIITFVYPQTQQRAINSHFLLGHVPFLFIITDFSVQESNTSALPPFCIMLFHSVLRYTSCFHIDDQNVFEHKILIGKM